MNTDREGRHRGEYAVVADKRELDKATQNKVSQDTSARNKATDRKVTPEKTAAKKKKTLVIVESPAKAKTIEKYLGESYTVLASMGHLIDLPKSRLGVDVEHNFEPEYLTVRGKAKLLKDLQKAAKKSDTVLLASDNDREGEAISYHLRNSLILSNGESDIKRIVFNEITPQAIRDAVKQPHEIDDDKVNAQKARRVLDRIVGYNLSPLLWKKVKNGLSAGRVQSVALRIICEREREVESFIPKEYWTLDAHFRKGRSAFEGELVSFKDEKPGFASGQEVRDVMKKIPLSPCVVSGMNESEKSLMPKPPFITSTLQQTAANRLGFTSRKTMQIAQQLYEGVNIGSARIGLISFMRTDSVRVSEAALNEARQFIGRNFPAELPSEAIVYATDRKSQDTHEAIRPTIVEYTPGKMKEYLSRDQQRLYTLIWERFMASQMTNALIRSLSIDLSAGDAVFRVRASRVVEKGFYKVIKLLATKADREIVIPQMRAGEEITASEFRLEQHFTQGAVRFTDASIIGILDELGIGRPSTYAPIISVLLERYYVTRENTQLVPTALGRMISEILVDSFPAVMDSLFTAGMESLLDDVEERKRDWVPAVREFYIPFKKRTDELMESLRSYRGSFDEATNRMCEKCGKPIVKKLGRFGFFLACTGFPECRNTKSIPLARCPKPDCGGDIVARKNPNGRGREFYGCTRFPECDFLSYYRPTNTACPKCGWFLVERFDKKMGSYKTCINTACDCLHSREVEHGAA